MFKLQVQDDKNNPRSWHDVRSPEGALLTFERESEARAKALGGRSSDARRDGTRGLQRPRRRAETSGR